METITREATENQIAYVRSLAASRPALTGDAPQAFTVAAILAGEPVSVSAASDAIDYLRTNVPAAAPADEGMYVDSRGTVYRIVASRSSGRPYAKKLVIRDGRGTWVYAPGAANRIGAAGLVALTVAQAAAMGHQYGVCVCCGRELTDAKSVEAGIGPVCKKRLAAQGITAPAPAPVAPVPAPVAPVPAVPAYEPTDEEENQAEYDLAQLDKWEDQACPF